jgi:putative ABC transport system substrate-binding protein
MVNVDDPVESGLVASLSHPGGNVTGLSRRSPELVGKSLALLKEAVPRAVRIAVLSNPGNPHHPGMVRNGTDAARSLGVRLTIVEARAAEGLEDAFRTMVRERVSALLVLGDGMFFFNRTRIGDLALRSRLPSMFTAQAGGLMHYGPNSADNYRHAATYVDKIFKGAKPGQSLRDPGVERWHGARLLGCAGGHWYFFVHRHGRPMRICTSLISSSLAPMKARMVCHSNLPMSCGSGWSSR